LHLSWYAAYCTARLSSEHIFELLRISVTICFISDSFFSPISAKRPFSSVFDLVLAYLPGDLFTILSFFYFSFFLIYVTPGRSWSWDLVNRTVAGGAGMGGWSLALGLLFVVELHDTLTTL